MNFASNLVQVSHVMELKYSTYTTKISVMSIFKYLSVQTKFLPV